MPTPRRPDRHSTEAVLTARVEAELRSRGRDVIAVDLPGDDESAGLPEYTDVTVEEMPGGHLAALSRPVALTDWLETYWAEVNLAA